MSRNIGVFVAWPYANGDLHLGHVAGAYLPSDIFARYHRLRGNKVMMVSGSDAHGTPITLKAKQEKETPRAIVERYHHRFLEGFQRLGISFDLFTLTLTKNHQALTQKFFVKLKEQGDLQVAGEEHFFDEVEQMFLPDRYVRGTCPLCNSDRARGDQCENCGKTFAATELKNPISSLSDTPPVLKSTDHYFFHMERYQEKIAAYVQSNPHWRTHVHNFTKAMIEDGLKPRAITRDIDWGVPVPEVGWEKKVIYVWFDAVIGYLSGSLEFSEKQGLPDAWKSWWKDSQARNFYFIGKDNIPFHTVIWPLELMAYDETLNLPYDVPANQFLNISGEKLSTSRGLAVWLLDVLDGYDADAIRYYMTSILPETKDSSFSWDEFITKNNGELVAAWGNLVNRVLGFAYPRYDGKVPEAVELDERDNTMLAAIDRAFVEAEAAYEEVRLRDALKTGMGLARDVNKYLDEKAPWTVFKEDQKRAGTAIFVAMRAIDSLKILLAPILPHTCQKIHELFGYQEPLFGESIIEDYDPGTDPHEVLTYHPTPRERSFGDAWRPSALKAGTAFAKPSPLFKVLEGIETKAD